MFRCLYYSTSFLHIIISKTCIFNVIFRYSNFYIL
nr:MAG TPA_asm: hypothetical protein [Bacteriophage sp.]